MVSQSGRLSMFPAYVLTGVLVIFVSVQGLKLKPIKPIKPIHTSPSESLKNVAELAVWESLGLSDVDYEKDDGFVTSLGLGPPPDYSTVNFVLYNRANATNGTAVIADPNSLKKVLNSKVSTKVFIHGYQNNLTSDIPVLIKNAYLNHSDYNLIMVNWSALALPPNYAAARSHTTGVANRTMLLLNALADSKISAPKDQHIIGHALGAQIAGLAAGSAKTKPGRCTGLDPSGLLFQGSTDEGRIDPSNANVVDIIHSSAAYWGLPGPLGQIDFYPNGGVWPQPGCNLDPDGSCSHDIAARFFAYTINNPSAFVGIRCQTPGVIRGKCPASTDNATMGEFLQFKTPGLYYLEANLPS